MRVPRPAILTVIAAVACGFASMARAVEIDAGPAVPPIPESIQVPAPRRFAIELVDGGRQVGPWLGFDLTGVRAEADTIPWNRIVPADRLRIGRELIRGGGTENAEDWGLLLAALDHSGADEMATRARARLESLAGPAANDLIAAALELAENARAADRAVDAHRASVSLKTIRPHQESIDPNAANPTVPVTRPNRLPHEIERDRAAWRDLVEKSVDGLGLELVPTAQVLVASGGTLDAAAAEGVLLDRHLDACRRALGGPPTPALPAGGVALMLPDDLDDARVLAARHLVDWPVGESSLVIPRVEGWLALVVPPSDESVERWRRAGGGPDSRRLLAQVESARIAGRVAMLEAGAGRVPGWMVEGFAEAAAQRLVPGAPLERSGRAAAVAALRAGRSPRVILSAASGEEAWAPDGEARRTAHLLMTRLLESGDAVVPGIVQALGSGASLDAAFRRWTGLSLDAWFADTVDWHRTND